MKQPKPKPEPTHCPDCGLGAPTFYRSENANKITYRCRKGGKYDGCGRRVTITKDPKPRGNKMIGTRKLTPRERQLRCKPPLPYARGADTWYVVSTLIDDGSAAVFNCLEFGRLRNIERLYPGMQVLKVKSYPPAKQREYAAMIAAAQTEENVIEE